MKLRPYQQEILDKLWAWFMRHDAGNPIVEAAVGAGKSLMIAAVCQRAHDEAPGTRVLVLMHQKELLEQNVGKISAIWPAGDVGVYSASKGRKELGHQVTYATIGSVWRIAHLLGRVDIVMADECHLINPKEEGMWRAFLKDLAKYNPHTRCVGWTGTNMRGNGVFLTAPENALFTGVAASVGMKELLELGFLSPLTPAETTVQVVAADLPTSGDDFQVSALAAATDTEELVESTASEIVRLSAGRRRLLVFAVTIEHAGHMAVALKARGISCDVVTAKTPAGERAAMIAAFRAGRLRCLVNVAVLTTGFDVPEVDFIALLRATKSPVLYVQIAGRGMRLADGKTDCLWADFTDTTLRLGPVDMVKGRRPRTGGSTEAPFKLCPECGSRNKATATECVDCNQPFPPPVLIKHTDRAGGDAVLSSQLNKEIVVPIDRVDYHVHVKGDGPNSMRVEYWNGIEVVAKEWVTLDHQGYPRLRAESWWRARAKFEGIPRTSSDGVAAAQQGAIRAPTQLKMNIKNKAKPEIVNYLWA